MTARDYYPYCAAARVAGAAPISRGPKDYGRHLDGDARGIARNKADTAFKIAKKSPAGFPAGPLHSSSFQIRT
ncbi:excalibur calcium-binding domain-containing protein [Parasphingorhabdus flavimaris]|uniref:excalibur calcium-binding domain-containing protein n=1 Tax=Parasphingorhabdus flavimaris TaxID=266812 RepID=UPI0030023685